MTTLNLTAEQAEVLKETLSSCIQELRMEISDTDKYDFREMLKKKEVLLKEIVAAL